MQIKVTTEDGNFINKWLKDNKDYQIIDIKRRDTIQYNFDGSFADSYPETMIMYEETKYKVNDIPHKEMSGIIIDPTKNLVCVNRFKETGENWDTFDLIENYIKSVDKM
jgi:hypothetical protein